MKTILYYILIYIDTYFFFTFLLALEYITTQNSMHQPQRSRKQNKCALNFITTMQKQHRSIKHIKASYEDDAMSFAVYQIVMSQKIGKHQRKMTSILFNCPQAKNDTFERFTGW